MNNTLTINTRYPLFSPNQVLSDDDLNGIVTYFEGQNRLNRHFIGMGIACGLAPSASFEPGSTVTAKIIISPGSGITSEGHVIPLLEPVTLTHYRKSVEILSTKFQVTPPKGDNTAASKAPVLYVVTELFCDNGNTSSSQEQEQFSESNDDNSERKELHTIADNVDATSFKDYLAKHTLLILIDCKDTARDTCLLDCDDLGRDREFKLRYLLLPKEAEVSEAAAATTGQTNPLTADALLQAGYAPDTDISTAREALQSRQLFFQDHTLRVPRFGYGDDSGATPGDNGENPLVDIENYSTFLERYRALCEQTIDHIDHVVPHVVKIFSPFFSSFQPQPGDLAAIKERLMAKLQEIVADFPVPGSSPTIDPFEAQYAIQYFYDYLVQVAAAYDELVQAAFDLMDDCQPEMGRFSKFLMLGAIDTGDATGETTDGTTEAPESPSSLASGVYRSHFIQPPLYNQNQQRRQQVHHLYDRLVRLCAADSFQPLPFYGTPVHITPSCDRTAPLSQQALPYYLRYAALYPLWNYDAARKGVSAQQPAYFLPQPQKTDVSTAADSTANAGIPAVRDELRHRLDRYNFYRIEGHLGKDKDTMLKQLRDYKQRWNLAFDIVTLKISDRIDPDDRGALDIPEQADRLAAITQDFAGIRQVFQTLWTLYESDWSQNVFLSTLKFVFFDQPKFSDIAFSQLYNPVLAAVRNDTDREIYLFDPVVDANNQPTEYYRLTIAQPNRDPIARVVFQREDGTRVEALRLPGASTGGSADEKARILTEISTALLAERITYGVEEPGADSSDPADESTRKFFVTLSLIDRLELPIESPGNNLRSVQVIIISQESFTIDNTDSGPLVAQSAFRDYETLYGLLRDRPDRVTDKTGDTETDETDAADSTSDSTSNDASLFPKGNRQAALDYIRPFHLPERLETYRLTSGQITGPQLFNQFTKIHPGLEHLGGVPKGGTFVLAYADDAALTASLLAVHSSTRYRTRLANVKAESVLPAGIPEELDQVETEFSDWTNIVVADYCLPYRLSSQIIHSPSGHLDLDLDPIVLLEKTNFCADDDTLYEFILHPPNGQLKGEGSFFANGKYCFQPSRVYPNLQHDVAIAFTYAVDGCESSLIVTINPLPDASFQVGKWNKTVFCANDEAISLIPCIPGGTFKALAGDEKIDISAQVLEDNLFLPEQVVLAGASQLKITLQYTVENEQKNCTNSHSEIITVHALPAVDFQIGTGVEDITSVCADVAFAPLNPEPANGLFRVLDGNHDISSRMLQGNRILPSAANLGELATKTITVEYSITDERGCKNTITKPLEILALPDAGFRIGEGEGIFCQNHGPVPLIPNVAGGSFRAMADDTTDISGVAFEQVDNQTRFLPTAVPLNNQQRVRITLIHTIGNSNGCEQRSQQTVIVIALPDAEFQVGESNNTDFFNDDPSVPLIPHMYGGRFSAFDGGDEITANVIAQKPHRFLPAAVDMDDVDSKEITLKYQLTLNGCSNEFESIVTIQVRPDEPEEDGGNPPDSDGDPDTPGDSGDSENSDDPEDPGDLPVGTDILENPSPIDIPIVNELFPGDLLGELVSGDSPIAEDVVGNDINFPDPIDLGST